MRDLRDPNQANAFIEKASAEQWRQTQEQIKAAAGIESKPSITAMSNAEADEWIEHFRKLEACLKNIQDPTFAKSARKISARVAAEAITDIAKLHQDTGKPDLVLPKHEALTDWTERLAKFAKTLDEIKSDSCDFIDASNPVDRAIDQWYTRAEDLLTECNEVLQAAKDRYGD